MLHEAQQLATHMHHTYIHEAQQLAPYMHHIHTYMLHTHPHSAHMQLHRLEQIHMVANAKRIEAVII